AGLADQPERLARGDLEGDLVDDVDAGARHLDAEVLDLQRGRSGAHSARSRPSMPAEALATPSPIRLVPIVSSAIAITGIATPHGTTVRPCRFSLIISPQSAFGCGVPNPRKLSPAIRPIEYVSRRLASTISGLVMFGRISPKRMRRRGSPITSAACTNSRSTTSRAAPRVTRATRGIVVSATASTSSIGRKPTFQASGPTVA